MNKLFWKGFERDKDNTNLNLFFKQQEVVKAWVHLNIKNNIWKSNGVILS